MARYIKSGSVSTVPEINSELEKIATSQTEFLTRNGEAPNEMKAPLDMNNNPITNLGAPSNATDAARFQDITGSVTVLTDEALVFDNIAEMTTANLVVGQYIRCKRYYVGGELVEGLVYEIQATQIVDGFVEHTLSNGNVAKIISSDRISVSQAGAVGDGVTDDTLALQATIDYVEDFGSGGQVQVDFPVVYIPTGTYLTTGLLIPSQITIEGSGRTSSVLILEKNAVSLIKKKYPELATANVAIRNIGMSPDDPAVNLPSGQTIFDARGFTKSLFDNITINWCGGCNGVSSAEAPYTGSSNWYLTFNHCFVERLASWPVGGIGWLIGSDDSLFQQSTTWTWTGGRTSGAGGTGSICFDFEGCSTMNLFGHTTEGGSVFIGSNTGDRATRAVIFYSCYAEAVSSFEFKTSSEICGIFGGRITGVDIADNGASNTILLETTVVLPIGNTGAAKFELVQAGTRYAKIKSSGAADPTWQFEAADGQQSEIIGGGDFTNRAFRFLANNTSSAIIEMGTNTVRPAVTETMTLGEASRRYTKLHISDSVHAQGSEGVTGDFALTGGGILSVKGGIVISYTP